jgi:hypothetical protein
MATRRFVSNVDYRKKQRESRKRWRKIKPLLENYKKINNFLKSFVQIEEHNGFFKKFSISFYSKIKIDPINCLTNKSASVSNIKYLENEKMCEEIEVFIIKKFQERRDFLYKELEKENMLELLSKQNQERGTV